MMKKVLVCGLSNIETSCHVCDFPIEYSPVEYNFFGISSMPSGVGMNVSLALSKLGDEVTFITYAGEDTAGEIVRNTVQSAVARPVILPCEATAQSVVLYADDGRRKVYTDLKDMQERSVEADIFEQYGDVDAFCLCNINFARGLLPLAKAMKKPVFTDVHCLMDIDDEYNRDFMRYAEVLFLSNENIEGVEERFIRSLAARYDLSIVVVGMGDKGAMLYEKGRDDLYHSPAVYTRPVVNTVGAGDALFSAFTHFYLKENNAQKALDTACRFASYKIGESGASRGFLSEDELLRFSSI